MVDCDRPTLKDRYARNSSWSGESISTKTEYICADLSPRLQTFPLQSCGGPYILGDRSLWPPLFQRICSGRTGKTSSASAHRHMGDSRVPLPSSGARSVPAHLHVDSRQDTQDPPRHHLATYGFGLEDRISSGDCRRRRVIIVTTVGYTRRHTQRSDETVCRRSPDA
jgi:hypothetical protein